MDHFNNYEELKEVNPTFYPRPRVVRQDKKKATHWNLTWVVKK